MLCFGHDVIAIAENVIDSGNLSDVYIIGHQDERSEADIEGSETVAARFNRHPAPCSVRLNRGDFEHRRLSDGGHSCHQHEADWSHARNDGSSGDFVEPSLVLRKGEGDTYGGSENY